MDCQFVPREIYIPDPEIFTFVCDGGLWWFTFWMDAELYIYIHIDPP